MGVRERLLAVSRLFLLGLTLVLTCGTGVVAGATLSERGADDLADLGVLLRGAEEPFPARAADLAGFLAQRKEVDKVSLFGGTYWLYAEISHDRSETDWVLDPNNTLIERVEAWIYSADSVQRLESGYRAEHEYMLHYGKRIRLPPGVTHRVLVKFSSPYFASYPRFELLPEGAYRTKVARENALAIGALGAVVALALFYLFIYLLTREKDQLYYSAYLIWFSLGWAFVFHVPAHLFGLRDLRLHYMPFFLLSPLSALFCIEFLKLRLHFPRLALACYAVGALSLLLLPSSFFALSYAHVLATAVISLWLPLALVCGVLCWRAGYRPARFFVLAFAALIVPGVLILPANVGLMPDLVENAELLTLTGGAVDAMLLAFALAEKIKLLGEEKDNYLSRLNQALVLSRTDAMTGIGNRHAFDLMFEQELKLSFMRADQDRPILVLVDLDGLKSINDAFGHARGDDLLRAFADALRHLEGDGISCYRLGGDEFAVFARRRHETNLQRALAEIEQALRARGFADSGVSFGVAHASSTSVPGELFNTADRRMYEHKAQKKQRRAAAVP